MVSAVAAIDVHSPAITLHANLVRIGLPTGQLLARRPPFIRLIGDWYRSVKMDLRGLTETPGGGGKRSGFC